MIKLLATLALIGAAVAELTCEDCTMIGEKVSAIASSPGEIEEMLDALLQSGVCQKFDNVEGCMQNLPVFWDTVAKALFDAKTGWFSSRYLCHDVCSARSIVSAPACEDC